MKFTLAGIPSNNSGPPHPVSWRTRRKVGKFVKSIFILVLKIFINLFKSIFGVTREIKEILKMQISHLIELEVKKNNKEKKGKTDLK